MLVALLKFNQCHRLFNHADYFDNNRNLSDTAMLFVYVPVNILGWTCFYQLPGFLFHLRLHLVFGINTQLAITNYHNNHSHHGIQLTLEQCQHVTNYRQLPGQ